MKEIIKLLLELEEEIVRTNSYRRCPDFEKDCIQCQFWARFDWIKKDLIDLKHLLDKENNMKEVKDDK